MKRIYEDFWRDRPRDPEPWRHGWRSGLLVAELRAGEEWLDLGCGAGRFLGLAPRGVGVDAAQEAVERAREHGDARMLADDGTLPLAHGSVDVVWCSETLEHVADALGLLQEARRVLRPGGRLLVTTPAHPWPRRVALAALRFDAHFDPCGQHLRFFTRRSLAGMLAAAGFEVDRIRTQHATLVARAVRAR